MWHLFATTQQPQGHTVKTPTFDNDKWERERAKSRADAKHRDEVLRWASQGHGQSGRWMKYQALARTPVYGTARVAAVEKEIDAVTRKMERAYRHQHSKSRFIRWITKPA